MTAALLRDLRQAMAIFQARTLHAMLSALPAEGPAKPEQDPVSKSPRNIPVTHPVEPTQETQR